MPHITGFAKVKKLEEKEVTIQDAKDVFSFEKLLESKDLCPMHIIARSEAKMSDEKYVLLRDCLNSENNRLCKQFLFHEDASGKTAIHYASTIPAKLDMMISMLEVVRKDTQLQKILRQSEFQESLSQKWFERFETNHDFQLFLIGLEHDSLLSFTIAKIRNKAIADYTAWTVNDVIYSPHCTTHPIDIVVDIFGKREFFKDSFQGLLLWEEEYHKKNLQVLSSGFLNYTRY